MGADVSAVDEDALRSLVRDIHDFPKPGATFKDITPLLADAASFGAVVDALATRFAGYDVDKVLGIEARGFIAAAPVADRLGVGFVPVRKAGKLPWHVEKEEYVLEYGTDLLEIHRDAIAPGQRALIVDDVMATGGTAAATIRLVEKLGAKVAGLAFIIELGFLDGRSRIGDHEVQSLITYE
jgi:adenine phosphoribosyltransferase